MRKHLTKTERESRVAAEASMRRAGRVVLKAPGWLSIGALEIFEATKKKLRGLGLLDNVNSQQLAMYSDAVNQYQKLIEAGELTARGATVAQAWSRVALSHAEKLGITVSARARLAKKKAEPEPVDPMGELLGAVMDDVTDYVNTGREVPGAGAAGLPDGK